MKNTIVLQSIDSPRRDTEWRIYLANKLAEKGISSIIGSKSAIRLIHMKSKNCIFLGRLDTNTGRTESDKRYIKEMEKNDTALFFMHDEGALYNKGHYEEYVRRIYPEDYFSKGTMKKVFFWGDSQKYIFKDSVYASKFCVTGFPRFDLCKPNYNFIDHFSTKDLHDEYGDFILVCGRFAAVNMVEDDPSALGKRAFDIR
ncbi:MAG: hypothetical protein R3208_18130, partial [Ketobacteraceae bacterium]|nr:hypothetical protein [Ketobacteraceae bacterium]